MKKLLFIFLILLLTNNTYSADTKLSDLAETTDIQSTDELYLNDAGTSKKITATNVFDMIDTSAELRTILGDETGSGAACFATSPTLVTPVLGTITSGVGTALTALNGENIQDDTIDDDSIDFTVGVGLSCVDITTTDCAAVTSSAAVTATTSMVIGSADLNETDMEKLDGITNGTAAANKALVLDVSSDIATINSLTATTLVGALTGNASTATALAADPNDCPANEFADAINASGTLSCNGVVDADVSDTLTASIIDLEAGTITNIADKEIMIGVGAADASYVLLSDDATMANTGAVSVVDMTCTDCINATEIEDIYLLDGASDTMTGTLTADGLTLGANENITLGSQTLDHDGTDFVFNDSINSSGMITGSGVTVSTTMNIPVGATPSVFGQGHIGIDTTFTDPENHGLIIFNDGTRTMNTVATTDTPGDNEVPKYDDATGLITWEADAGGSSGFLWRIEPQQAKLPSTNPMAIDAGQNWRGLFDDTTDECASWTTVMRTFGAGTLKAKVMYTLETTSSSDVVEIELSIACASDGESVSSAEFGTVDNLSSGSVSTTLGERVTLSDASLNEDSCTQDDTILLKLCRDADDTDTTTDDVEFRGAIIYE